MVFGLYANRTKKDWRRSVEVIGELVEAAGNRARVFAEADVRGASSYVRGAGGSDVNGADLCGIDVLIALGGDGTILRVAQTCAEKGIPILGVNAGRLGYLTEVGFSECAEAIRRVCAGDYRVDERMMLSARVPSVGTQAMALNEISAFKRNVSRTVELEYYIDGELGDRVVCDGLLVSTPTGSTGYSLSAGGPLMEPGIDCLSITPVCAHSLVSRPIVIGAGSKIEIKHNAHGDNAVLAADGEEICEVAGEDYVLIEKSDRACPFIRLSSRSFYGLVREKLSKG